VPTELCDICTFHNIESHLLERADGKRDDRVNTARELETNVLRSVRAAVTFSALDAERARDLVPSAPLTCVALGYQPEGAVRKHNQSSRLSTAIFVGTLSYAPNREAVRVLLRLWPRMRDELGLDRLVFVGRDAGSVVRAGGGIEVHSNVPQVAPILTQADVLLVPLATGGGVRVKIIEAFALGVPVVATKVGIEGLGAVDDTHAVVVDGPDAIIEGLRRARDVSVRTRLAGNAYELWRERYSPEKMIDSMLQVYDKALGSPAG
jgi:glycosyltransferase involved in cell wall biosynthesis